LALALFGLLEPVEWHAKLGLTVNEGRETGRTARGKPIFAPLSPRAHQA
jgi:hypothetical protein